MAKDLGIVAYGRPSAYRPDLRQFRPKNHLSQDAWSLAPLASVEAIENG